MNENFFVAPFDATDEYESKMRYERNTWIYRSCFYLTLAVPTMFPWDGFDATTTIWLVAGLMLVSGFVQVHFTNQEIGKGVRRETVFHGGAVKQTDFMGSGKEVELMANIDEEAKVYVKGRFLHVRRNWPWRYDIRISPAEFHDSDSYASFIAYCEERGARVMSSAHEEKA